MYMQRAETRTNVDANNSLKDNRESWKPDWSKSSWRVTEIGGAVPFTHQTTKTTFKSNNGSN